MKPYQSRLPSHAKPLGIILSGVSKITMQALHKQIEFLSVRLGFAMCRFCAISDAPADQRSAFGSWLDAGMNGTMGWFGRSAEARIRPHSRFPWAKSIVSLRWDYQTAEPDSPPNSDPRRHAADGSVMPRIARYARGLDYHEVLKPKLEQLETFIKSLAPDTQARWYMDTGPVLEHLHAARAGVGWTGKHTLTLNEHAGSYFFLAEIITSLELPPNPPATDHCGTCTACIDACPTDAIVAPYVLDARRCISYLTIEHKGPIPEQFRGQMAGYLFGCDICQEVCPHVRKQIEREGTRGMTDEWRQQDFADLRLVDVLRFSDKKLAAAIAGTPLERTGVDRLRRNAAMLAGEEKLSELMVGLTEGLRNPNPVVREACIWALSQFAGTASSIESRKALSTHQKRESEDELREKTIEALMRLTGDDGSVLPTVVTPTDVRTVERQGRSEAPEPDEPPAE